MPAPGPPLPAGATPPAALTYGADDAGLVCGYRFRAGDPVEPIDSLAAAIWLRDAHAEATASAASKSTAGEDFIWLHFNLAHAASERWLNGHVPFSAALFDALREGSHATRVERADDALIAVVNDVHFDFAFEPSDIAALWIGADRRVVVTARQRPLRSVDRLRAAVKSGAELRSPVDLLGHLLRDQADVLVEIVRDATTRVDDIEDDLLAGRLDRRRARLGAIRRLLVRLQRLLAPEPAALFRLLQTPPPWMPPAGVEGLRGSTEEFAVVLRDMASLQERIKLLQEEIAAQVAEENNKSLFVLTIVTVLALPINIVAGLLGMNVGGVPLAEAAHGFWVVVAIVASFTAAAAWWVFRRRRER